MSRTGVSLPGPSARQELPRGLTRDSWNDAWDKYHYRGNWNDAWDKHHDGDRWADAWHKQHHHDNWADTWSKHEAGDKWRSSHWETSGWRSSHWETSGWNKEDQCSHNRDKPQWLNHTFFETMNVDQLISSLHRGEENVTTVTGLEVDPGESLADTAAQCGVIDLRPFRKAEEALFHKFGLKPRVICSDNQAVGIGGKAKVLGKVELPFGMGGVNGIVKYTVVDSPGVPPLTPVSLLKQVGAVIDLNNNTMELKKIDTTTSLRVLPSGHVAHKLAEFAPGGWRAPTLEQTKLFQARSGGFRPVTLPGEFRSRQHQQCAGFSSGFAYTVLSCSHPSPCHHQRDHDLCIDGTVATDFLSGDVSAQEPSTFECSFASGFGVDAQRHDQPESHSDRRGRLSQKRTRTMPVRDATASLTSSTQFRTDHALPWMEPRRDAVYLDQSVPRQSRRPWRVEEYQPYQRWRFSDEFWWPTHTLRTRRWRTGPASYQRLDGPDASLGCKPSVGARTVRPVAASPSTIPAPSIPAAARGVVHTGSVASVPALRRGRRVH